MIFFTFERGPLVDITIFIATLTPGGTERVTCNLSNYLVENDYNVTILTLLNTYKPAYELDRKIKCISLSENKGQASNKSIEYCRHITRYARLWKFIRKNKTDLYLVMLPLPTYMLLSLRRIIKVPIIVSERSDPNQFYKSSKVKRALMKRLFPRSDAFIFQTEDAKAFYREIITAENIVIPNPINRSFIRKPFTGERKKVIVAAGRLCEPKNYPMLLEAFSLIASKHIEYQLVIYGSGGLLQELVNKTEELNIADKVFFAGQVSDIADCIIDSALFVLSSDYEGMPNALMEAMALGLPCISTDCPCGGPRFLIQNKNNGLLVPVGNTEAMAEAMDMILSDKDLAQSLGNNASAIQSKVHPDIINAEWDSYFKKIHKRKNRANEPLGVIEC